MLRTITAALVVVTLAGQDASPERIDHEVNARIRQEGRASSQIMRTMHHLTDGSGPRLTGSPNHKAAAEWAVKQLTEWGLQNGRLEPWEFGHPGWLNERFAGFIVSPVKDSLVGEVLAWTPSTDGTVVADALQIVPPERPTDADLTAWIEQTRASVKGRIVLVGRHTPVPVTIGKAPLRRDFDDLRRQYDPAAPAPQPRRYAPPEPTPQGRLTAAAVSMRIDAMLLTGGALVRINDAGRDHGQIRAFHNRTFDVTRTVGATSTSSRRAGGTDSTSFNEAGLPGISLQQDPIEYTTYTWHTNLDTYERIIEGDAQKSAIAIAAAVYHLATREDMLPRFTKDQMPARPARMTNDE